MKRLLRIAGLSVAVLVVLLAALFFLLFGGLQSQQAGPALGPGVEPVYDGFVTCYLLDAGNREYVLVDAGTDPAGAAILAALAARQATPNDVIAILITHAHADHDAAISLFPRASVYALRAEVPLAVGQQPYGSPFSRLAGRYNPHPFQVAHPLEDGETVTLGDLEVTAFAVPGHTPGSAAYLAGGVLFLGDAAQLTTDGRLVPPPWIFSRDTAEAEESLQRLAGLLLPRAGEIRALATAHTGRAEGLRPLLDLAAR